MSRNAGLDILRIICAWLIVIIHNTPGNILGFFGNVLARIAVPIFFMMSGFLYENVKVRGRRKGQIVKIIKLIVLSTLMYIVFFYFVYGLNGNYLEWLKGKFTSVPMVRVLLLNVNPLVDRFWYFNAYLYVLLVVYAFDYFDKLSTLKAMTPFLLAMGLIAGPYSRLLVGGVYAREVCRNFLFVGIPYFMVGYVINEHQVSINTKKGFIATGILAVAVMVEAYAITHLGITDSFEYVIFTIPMAIVAFLTFKDYCPKGNITMMMSKWGREDSLNVYINHRVTEHLLALIGIGRVPTITFALSLLMSIGYRKLKAMIGGKIHG